MSNGELKVNFSALTTAAADITTRANNIETRLGQLDTDLSPLKADWTGEASNQYQVAKTQWTNAINDMQALLLEVGRSVGESNDAYQNADRTNASRW